MAHLGHSLVIRGVAARQYGLPVVAFGEERNLELGEVGFSQRLGETPIND